MNITFLDQCIISNTIGNGEGNIVASACIKNNLRILRILVGTVYIN